MADGNLGSLFMSLDIKDETGAKLIKVAQNIADVDKKINSLQQAINESSKELNKLSEGSSMWNAQRESIRGMVTELNRLVGSLGTYQKDFDSLKQKMSAIDAGKLVLPHKTITSYLDTKPIEAQIQKLEKYEQILKRIQDLQGRKNDISLDAQTGLGGTHAWDVYQKRIQEVDELIARSKASLQEIGGGNMNLGSVRSQLDSLYGTLERFENANKNATISIRDNRSELEKHRAKQKEVEAAFAPLLAAQQRAAQQEAANRANIEATNIARQKQVQVLREQSEAILRAKLSDLQSNRTQMAGLYSTGKNVGLNEGELANIRQRYQEISREILTIQTLLQNSKGLSYNEMFSFGRNVGPSGSYVKEAANSISRAKQETERLKQETESSARAARELASAFRQAHDASSRTSGVISDIKSLLLQGGIVYGAQQFANSIIQTGGEIAQQHIALRNIIGDARKADELFAQTQKLALESPFTFGDLNRDVKQLAAFGVEADTLYDTTKRLADVSSGLGVSFERLGLAYGQVKSRSWLDGKELRQFAYAGLPLLQKIADLYNETGKDGRNNYSTKDIRDMITKRQVSFEDVDSVIKKLTDEGGQFYNMQYVLSDTLLGRWNKLIDAWDIMLGKFADGKSAVGSFFMSAINGAVTLVQSIDKLGPIFLAAFSGIALKKLSTSIGGGFAGSFLSSKQALAAKYQEKALTGELSAEEQRILSTKTQITTKDLETLAATRAITMADLQRAYVTRQITTEQYKSISALLAQQRQTTTLSARFSAMRVQVSQMFTANYWQNFGARGLVAFNLLKAGAVSLGTTIWSAIGGLPGLLITGATMLFANWMQENEELKQTADSIAENTKQTYDDLRKYIEENPINIRASISDIADQINKEKDILKEKAGSGYDSIIINVSAKAKGDPSKQLEYLRQYTDLYARAAEKAQAMKSVFAEAESESNVFYRESIKTNLEDLEKSAQALSLTTSKMSMAQLVKEAQELKSKSDISSDFKKFADIILEANKNGLTLDKTLAQVKETAVNMSSISYRGTFGTDISKFVGDAVRANSDSRNLDANIADFANSLSGKFENLTKDPMEQATYRVLKDAWKNANNLDVVQGAYFDMKLDQAMGLKEFPSLAEDMAKDAASRISESTRQILASGQPLTKAAQDDIRKATNKAMEHFRATWPGNADEIQRMISSRNFSFNVMMHVIGDKSVTQGVLDDFYLGKSKFLGNSLLLQPDYQGSHPRQFSQKGESYYKQWSNGGSSPDEVEKKAKEEVDKALETYNSAVRQRGQNMAKPYLDALNSARAAFKEVIGYSYAGEATGITKKNNTKEEKARKAVETAKRNAERAAEKARRAEERRQREILRSWQSRKKLLEEYYETWNKWRNIEGKEDAKARLRNDKRFGSISKTYTDPENLAGNLSKLVEGYKKLAKTEDQHNFLAEARTEAAKKEADLEFINAERLVKSLNEQLNLLSKQYDIYQKLSKFTTSAAAAEYAFGSYNVSRARKGSYYGYLHDTLNSLQGKKVTPKAFVDNSVPDSDKDKLELSNVLVTASAKRADFGPDGLEGVLAMTDADIEEKFGKESRLVKILIDYKKERAALDSEIAEGLSKGYEFEDDYAAQIEYNNKRLDEQIERLRERNKLSIDHPQHISNDTLAEAELSLRKKTTRENNDLSFKQMQRETGWNVALGNLGAMSSGVVDRIKREVETRLDADNLSDDERGKLNEALTKLNEQFEKSDPFSSIVKGYDIVKAIDSIRNGSKDQNGQYTIDAQKARSVGLKVSKDNKYSDADLDEAQANVFRGFDTSIKAISDGFQSLQTVLQPVVELFDSLGNKGIGEGAQIAGKAVNSGMNVAGGIKNLQNLVGPDTGLGQALGKAGPYAAAAAAALSVFSSLWNKKTASQKAYEKQAEYLKNIQGAVKEINGSLKEKVSSSYGSQSQVYGDKIKNNLQTEAQELRRTYYLWTEAKEHRGGHRNRVKVSDFANKLNEWLKDNGLNKAIIKEILLPRLGWMNLANGGRQITNFGSQELQWLNGDVLRRYRDEHAGEWANLNSTAKEIFNRLIEIEGEGGEIQKTTEETAKALTDMDLSSLKSEWVDLLNNLDSANEDFADNFEKHMRNAILNGMIANQYSDQLKKLNEENAKRGGSEKGNKYVAKDGSIKQHTGGDDSKDVLSEYTAEEYRLSAEAYQQYSEQARQTRDVLKKIYGWSDKDSKSRSGSNIKGITENTGDIIASYLNAIKLDVSVDRPNIQKIADAVASMPEISGIAQSQLSQLTTLVTLAQYRNGRLDDMYDWMRSVTKEGGTKHLAV